MVPLRSNYAVVSHSTIVIPSLCFGRIRVATRWDENAGVRRDAIRSQVIDALEAQEIKDTGNEEG